MTDTENPHMIKFNNDPIIIADDVSSQFVQLYLFLNTSVLDKRQSGS
jgi:hypothetical protein